MVSFVGRHLGELQPWPLD